MSASPRSAVIIVLRRDDRLLAIRRAVGVPRAGWWSPPSGRVEAGEDESAAVVREAREELGIVVAAVARVWECQSSDGAWRLGWWTARERGGVLRPDPREVAEARWVTAAQFLALEPLFPAHREFLTTVWPALAPADGERSPADASAVRAGSG